MTDSELIGRLANLRDTSRHATTRIAELSAENERLSDALGRAYTIAHQQRCERETPWDRACVTVADKLLYYADCVINRGMSQEVAEQATYQTLASGMEARQGGDVKQAPSRSDDSPPGRPDTVTPSSQDTDQ